MTRIYTNDLYEAEPKPRDVRSGQTQVNIPNFTQIYTNNLYVPSVLDIHPTPAEQHSDRGNAHSPPQQLSEPLFRFKHMLPIARRVSSEPCARYFGPTAQPQTFSKPPLPPRKAHKVSNVMPHCHCDCLCCKLKS